MKFIDLSTANQLDQLLANSDSEPILIFKHSNSCGLSTRAFKSISKLTESSDPDVHMVTIQASRPLSNQIESQFGIRHESPQIFLISKGKVVFNASHHRATAKNVRKAVSENETNNLKSIMS